MSAANRDAKSHARNQIQNLLDPEVAARLKSLELRARLVVEGFISGLHKSPYHGFSVEFAEHRQYMPGDPVQHVDWKVYGKTDRYFLKEFEEETNLRCQILLDCSGSMAYASGDVTKFQYAQTLAASLAYLMQRQRDAVGLTAFSNRIVTELPSRSATRHLHLLLRELARLEPGNETDTGPVFHHMAERLKRRGLVIVISDLLTDPTNVLRGFKHFRHRRHEVVVFQVLDRQEREFAFPQAARFEDLETGEVLPTLPAHIRVAYRAQMGGLIERYRRECLDSLIDFHLLDTSVPFGRALYAYLGKRGRLF
jgi:uncharacterized protein (DUF58 family)